MKKIFSLLFLFTVPFAFYAQLNGIYTIGASPSDYSNISGAVNDINSLGVSGPVVFNIKDGTYNISTTVISEVEGVSDVNTITFQSESLQASDVTIHGNSIFKLLNVHYVFFKYLTFNTYSSSSTSQRTAFSISSGASHITISDCIFNGGGSPSIDYFNDHKSRYTYIILGLSNQIMIQNNEFSRNGAVLYKYSTTYSDDIYFTNNSFSGNFITPISLKNIIDLTISGNEIIANVKYKTMELTNISGELLISNNRIFTPNSDLHPGTYGTMPASIRIIGASGVGNLTVKNNFFSVRTTVSASNFTTSNFINNSFSSLESNCLSVYIHDDAVSYNLFNNVFKTIDNEPNVKFYNGLDLSKLHSNNNAFSKPIGSVAFFESFVDDIPYNLADWVSLTGEDTNSKVVGDVYVSDDDFHTPNAYMLDGNGIALSGVSLDIDNEPRNATHPDIGADEFDMDYSNYFDLELVEIISPTNVPCEDSNAIISIKNNSSVTITNFDIDASINNYRGNVKNYTITIDPDETIEVNVENFDLRKNTIYDKIQFIVSNPNGHLDNNYENNLKQITDVFQLGNFSIIVKDNDCGTYQLIVPLIANATVLWSTGETSNMIIVSETGAYSATLTDGSGCQITISITI